MQGDYKIIAEQLRKSNREMSWIRWLQIPARWSDIYSACREILNKSYPQRWIARELVTALFINDLREDMILRFIFLKGTSMITFSIHLCQLTWMNIEIADNRTYANSFIWDPPKCVERIQLSSKLSIASLERGHCKPNSFFFLIFLYIDSQTKDLTCFVQ